MTKSSSLHPLTTHMPEVDVIDEFCLMSIFDDAAKYLSNINFKIDTNTKLKFYALFKQATIGRCNTPKPGLTEMQAHAKWNAWNDLDKMSKDEAIAQYVKLLDKIRPTWREENENSEEEEEKEEMKKHPLERKQPVKELQFVSVQSRPVFDNEDEDKTSIHYVASNNDLNELQLLLQKGISADSRDSEGRTALMLAADRGHLQIVDFLLKHDVNVNLQSNVHETALLLAVMCEHSEIVELLLRNGADPDLVDNDGESARTLAEGECSELIEKLAKSKMT